MTTLAKFTSDTQSGRLAILARASTDEPWVQVESVLGSDIAADMVERLESDDEYRSEMTTDYATEEWGDDAPRTMPDA